MLYVQGGSCHLYTVIYNHFLNIKYTEYSRLEVCAPAVSELFYIVSFHMKWDRLTLVINVLIHSDNQDLDKWKLKLTLFAYLTILNHNKGMNQSQFKGTYTTCAAIKIVNVIRSSDPIYIVSYYKKWVTTTWTYSTWMNFDWFWRIRWLAGLWGSSSNFLKIDICIFWIDRERVKGFGLSAFLDHYSLFLYGLLPGGGGRFL